MPDAPQVILSCFGDEAAYHKTAVEQFAPLAALGLQYYTLRSIDAGRGVKNVLELTTPEVQKIRHLEDEYDLSVCSIGSPIGKVKLVDVDDGSTNKFVPFAKYLDREVRRACELAHAFETKLIRGFSFYPPRGEDPRKYLPQAVAQIGEIAEACHRSDLTFGLEVEANLVGRDGHLLAEIHRQVNHPALVLIFDAANLLTQGLSPNEVFENYLAMKPAIGWMHIKDYRYPRGARKTAASGKKTTAKSAAIKTAKKKAGGKPSFRHIDEAALTHFVPADVGQCGHDVILRDFRSELPALEKKLRRRGIPGVFLDLEPHLKAGGQFGGASGPDGMGVALRGLLKILNFVEIGYHQRDFDDVQVDCVG